MPTNKAATIPSPHSPLSIQPAPYPTPNAHDLIIKTAYVAINPLEYKIQDTNPPIAGKPLQYPTILGADISGTVIQLGSSVKNLEIGDRVIANCTGAATGKPESSAFQSYVVVSEASVTRLPVSVELERGVVLPLACDTAMAGLFTPGQLGLSPSNFSSGEASLSKEGEVVLVWGGSSSVGCSAIQLAVAAGYVVYTTASSKNHALCKEVGAAQVFDYSDSNVEKNIVSALAGKRCAGAIDCISSSSTITSCAKILSKVEGTKKVMTVLTPPEGEKFAEGVEVQRLSIPGLRQSEVYDIVHAWMPRALAEGKLLPKPDPMVIGEGLEFVQQGLDLVRKGVSATKVVVKLPA